MMPGRKAGVAILGAGLMGRTYAEVAANYLPAAQLAAVAVGSRAQQLAAQYEVPFEASVNDLLARRDVDAVVIATPEATHLEFTLLAAAAGKHVLVEKPMAPDVAQCQAMIEGCNAAGVTLMVVQSQRFRGVNRRAKVLLEQGRIGRVWQIRLCSLLPLASTLGVAQERPWQTSSDNGGAFLGHSVHAFDLLRWFAGSEARRLYAQVGDYAGHNLAHLSIMAQVEFENGVMAQLWSCQEAPDTTMPHSRFRCQIVGEKGMIDLDSYGYLDLATDGRVERIWEQPPFDPLLPLDGVRLESYTLQNQAFLDAIIHNHPPPVTGADGRAAVELCLAALQSAERQQAVSLPRY